MASSGSPSGSGHSKLSSMRGDTALLLEQFLEQCLRAFKSLRREHHRLHLADGIVNHALLMKTAEHIPIESLPCPILTVQGQIEQGQRGVVDLVLVDCHLAILVSSFAYPIGQSGNRNAPARAGSLK